ncbi:hypothetical protein [Azospirillum doebereinerae]|uniref:hypothetical protein n=1 Tax=Azospirillum doebereinerae TaxID=92933 RepID=UPI001FCFEDF9|nr:hypothetical protein [Azospirillum doebereinerae]
MTAPDGLSHDAPDGLSVAPGSVLAPSPLRLIPCGVRLAEAVRALSALRGSTPSDLASAALLLVPDAAGDPGESDEDGRAGLALRSCVRGSDSAIRRALAAAVALADPGFRVVPAADVGRLEAAVETLGYRNKTLAHALKRLSFQPLDGRVTELRDAVQMFGFVNEWCFDEDQVRRRFRELAPVYHPDTGVVACRERMGQLIDARNLLVRHVRTVYASGDWVARRSASASPPV